MAKKAAKPVVNDDVVKAPKIDNDYLVRRIKNVESKIFGPDYTYHDAISQGDDTGIDEDAGTAT